VKIVKWNKREVLEDWILNEGPTVSIPFREDEGRAENLKGAPKMGHRFVPALQACERNLNQRSQCLALEPRGPLTKMNWLETFKQPARTAKNY
jgi:hypothetical protein